MIRTPNIPQPEPKEFDPKTFEEEKEWLSRVKSGKITVTKTDGGYLLVLTTAMIVAIVIGGSIGALITIFTRSYTTVAISMLITFVGAVYFLKRDYASVELDPERGQFLYDGTVNFGGEPRSTRYRGPYQVVEGVYLVRLRRFRIFTSKPYIRLVTRSGYLRVNFKPDTDAEFLAILESMDLADVSEMQQALKEDPIRVESGYFLYYEKRFDRTEFFANLKKEREEERARQEEEAKRRRQELLEKSKKTKEE